jgi:hypothetical protein
MQVVDDLLETVCLVLLALLVEKVDLDTPLPHREALLHCGFVAVPWRQLQL